MWWWGEKKSFNNESIRERKEKNRKSGNREEKGKRKEIKDKDRKKSRKREYNKDRIGIKWINERKIKKIEIKMKYSCSGDLRETTCK